MAEIMSAEELLNSLRGCDHIEGDWDLSLEEALKLIDADRATQRQAGREEAGRELIEHCAHIAVEYMEETDRWDETVSDSGYLRQYIIDKALADLDEAKAEAAFDATK